MNRNDVCSRALKIAGLLVTGAALLSAQYGRPAPDPAVDLQLIRDRNQGQADPLIQLLSRRLYNTLFLKYTPSRQIPRQSDFSFGTASISGKDALRMDFAGYNSAYLVAPRIRSNAFSPMTITNDSWAGGAGSWTNAALWSEGVPTSSSAVSITAANSSVALNTTGSAYSLTISNNSTINGGTLTLGTGGGSLSSGSSINGATVTNPGTVQLFGGSITGGTLTNSGTISTTLYNNGNFSNTLGGAITNKSGATIAINDYTGLTLASGATLSNAVTIALNSSGNQTQLVIDGSNLTLGGGGAVTMSNNANNFIYGGTTTNTLTNQETIQGAGNIGDGQMTLVNSGAINANQPKNLTIDANGGFTNTGLLSVA